MLMHALAPDDEARAEQQQEEITAEGASLAGN